MSKKLKLYRIWQIVNTGYDTFDAAVVAAYSAEEAARIVPDGDTYAWVDNPKNVNVVKIGKATDNIKPNSVICASFHAG